MAVSVAGLIPMRRVVIRWRRQGCARGDEAADMENTKRKHQAWGEGAEEGKRVSHCKALQGPSLKVG